MLTRLAALLPLLLLAACASPQATAPRPPRIVLIAAEPEYHSDQSLARLAQWLREDLHADTTVLTASPVSDTPDNIPGMRALDDADLAILFLRFCRPPADQLAPLDRYLRAGKPILGLRTSTHAFAFDAASPLSSWNSFGPRILGAPWIQHASGDTQTAVTTAPHADTHPADEITRGLPAFACRSWLYHLSADVPILGDFPPPGARTLLLGTSVRGSTPEGPPQPVAWTWSTPWGGRVFTTTLGHPEDFARPEMRTLLTRAAGWTLHAPVSPSRE